ncbi:S49 family peptidase [Spirosoma rhododendri]|uniref:S49 family peptidase n=1 Tax=Spirosoma rhododendri TaxID=2728024 RepID=A0A7L5DSJ0_9BACT|nr:S49 family peptidase [Spirosoma rhododendri]QJD79528.1 S49 family peptidase [Spirosoma rhododendri]
MISQFQILSALLRHKWAIEPIWAEQHQTLLDSYLAGKLDLKLLQQNAIDEAGGVDPISSIGYVLASDEVDTPPGGPAVTATNPRNRYALDNPDLPENSVFVLDIRGPIMKETTCCTLGTEDYAKLIRRAYAHPKIIGIVNLVDSPGGQLFGTPTLYDAIRDPQKPVVSVVCEGLMASAAYWLACGSDEILATQQTDMIGSIGVFVSFRDNRKALALAGIEVHTVYSDRSAEKNKPFRDALEGDTAALTEDLNQAADLFRVAVETGRGAKLKPVTKGGADVFKGGLFYASKAIELGLIDGFGDLDVAVARVAELAKQPRATAVEPTPAEPTGDGNDLDDEHDNDNDPEADASTPVTEPVLASQDSSVSPTNQTDTTMFGDKHKLITALAGVESSAITDDQLNAINANLDAQNIKGIRVISQGYLDEMTTSATALTTAQEQVSKLTQERDQLQSKVNEYGSQPGVLGTTSQKTEEPQVAAGDDEEVISETDAKLRSMASLKGK